MAPAVPLRVFCVAVLRRDRNPLVSHQARKPVAEAATGREDLRADRGGSGDVGATARTGAVSQTLHGQPDRVVPASDVSHFDAPA